MRNYPFQFQIPILTEVKGRKAVIAFLAVVLISLWFRAGYPAFGVWGTVDDALFVRTAQSIASGRWLGKYDFLVLAKGAFFPFFIAINKLTGLPLKIAEHLLYLAASIFAALALSRLTGQRWLLLVGFLVLAFFPIPWGGTNARVVREPLYQVLSLALFFLAARFFMEGEPGHGRRFGKTFGVVAGCYWLTREEGIWLLPALAVLALPAVPPILASVRECQHARLKEVMRWAITPLVAFLSVVMLVNSINWVKYKVFRNNDFRSGPFAQAYGALARIKHDQWKRYVVFPRDARERAYSVSPAARELAGYFEGDSGQGWIKSSQGYPKPWGCVGEPQACNDEILSGWFVWALRNAVAAAGHYQSATDADAYYKRLAEEINAACDNNTIPCRERRDSLAPVWRGHYLRDTLLASTEVLMTLVDLGPEPVGVPASDLTPEQARIFQTTINGWLNGLADDGTKAVPGAPSHLDDIRIFLTRKISALYAGASPYLAVFALASYFFLLFAWVKVKSARISRNSIVMLTALAVAVASRVGMLGFFEATSFPSNNLLYLLPVVPLYLLSIVAGTGLGVVALVNIMRGERTAS